MNADEFLVIEQIRNGKKASPFVVSVDVIAKLQRAGWEEKGSVKA